MSQNPLAHDARRSSTAAPGVSVPALLVAALVAAAIPAALAAVTHPLVVGLVGIGLGSLAVAREV